MIKETFFIISSEYLNYYYLCPRTATVVFRSKEIPFCSINHKIYILTQIPEIIHQIFFIRDLPRKSTANKMPQLFINIA